MKNSWNVCEGAGFESHHIFFDLIFLCFQSKISILFLTFFIKKFPRECCRTSFFSRRRWTWNWTSELQRFNNLRHRVGASRCQLASFLIAPFKKRSYSGLSREESLRKYWLLNVNTGKRCFSSWNIDQMIKMRKYKMYLFRAFFN